MNFALTDLLPVATEITLLVLASVVLLADLFVKEQQRHVIYWLTQITLVVCAFTAAQVAFKISTPVAYSFSGMVVADPLGHLLKTFSCLSMSLVLFYSRSYLEARGLFRGEFFILALFSLFGMLVMISAAHLLTLYLGLELLSLSLYALVALHRDNRSSSEAAMKYFVLGALASGLLLYGMSMLYGATGSLNLEQIRIAIENGQANRTILVFALVFLVSGIAFKLGAVPYHMWVPDVYHGSPTAVTTIIGTVPKLAALAFTLRLLVGGLQPLLADWRQMLAVLAVLSLIIGNVTAIAQTNIKRMLAYSTIAHMGFLLLGIGSGTTDAYGAATFYVFVYVLTGLVGFGMIMLMSREGFEAERLEDFRGLSGRSPWFAAVMAMVMFSMAGIPVFVGFWAKLNIILEMVKVDWVALAVVAVLTSLVGAFYYLRVVKLMWFDTAPDAHTMQIRFDTRLFISLNGLALLVIGLRPAWLLDLCKGAVAASIR